VYPASYTMGTEDLTPRKYSGQAVKLTSHFLPLLTIRMSERRNGCRLSSDYTASDDRMMSELAKNMEEVITTYFEISSQTSGGTKVKRETPVFGLRVKIVTQISRT